jgi:hypothetical protein
MTTRPNPAPPEDSDVRKPLLPIVLIALLSNVTYAESPAGAPASDASIREVMVLVGGRSLMEKALVQVDTAMKSAMDQAMGGRPVSDEQQKILDDMRAEAKRLIAETLTWEKMEPMFIANYRSTFTQPEIDGMLKFYRSDIGRAVIAKLPLVMSHAMQNVQDLMKDLVPKLQQLQRDTEVRLHSAKEPTPDPPPEPTKP